MTKISEIPKLTNLKRGMNQEKSHLKFEMVIKKLSFHKISDPYGFRDKF
jgi:hypothetical protein